MHSTSCLTPSPLLKTGCTITAFVAIGRQPQQEAHNFGLPSIFNKTQTHNWQHLSLLIEQASKQAGLHCGSALQHRRRQLCCHL